MQEMSVNGGKRTDWCFQLSKMAAKAAHKSSFNMAEIRIMSKNDANQTFISHYSHSGLL